MEGSIAVFQLADGEVHLLQCLDVEDRAMVIVTL